MSNPKETNPSTTSAPSTGAAGISPEQFKELLATIGQQNIEAVKAAIEASKLPTVLEQKKLDEAETKHQENLEERRANAAGQKQKLAQKKADQHACTHKHANGHSHMVLVYDNNRAGTNYLMCQSCQAVIRPGVAPENYGGLVIFDTNLYNQLFQTLPTNELFQ